MDALLRSSPSLLCFTKETCLFSCSSAEFTWHRSSTAVFFYLWLHTYQSSHRQPHGDIRIILTAPPSVHPLMFKLSCLPAVHRRDNGSSFEAWLRLYLS
jgi:hypothetical protein